LREIVPAQSVSGRYVADSMTTRNLTKALSSQQVNAQATATATSKSATAAAETTPPAGAQGVPVTKAEE
jgi:hypothetical protein